MSLTRILARLRRATSWERIYPYAISVPVSASSLLLGSDNRQQMVLDVAPQLLVVLAITVGFAATSMTILFTAPDVEAIKLLKSHRNAFKRLVGYHHLSVDVGLVAATVTLVVLIACRQMDNSTLAGRVGDVVVACWWFVSALTLTTFYRALRLLAQILTLPQTSADEGE